ncbi:protein-L-isoaspartate O-methyltransferase family protein [Paractinoplanes globisporus]|uniref:Protein-L-isoaspartate O-methyltransferase n=1 Tax=Paractinoplanes globisporus TaxID=113565 RepID=A0ABW6WPZ7_9ACTN|nr:methyltransferase domain-containing protein [Actinoplanes globisporus]
MTGPRGDYVQQIRRAVELPPELAAAFAGVPREAFVPEGFQRRDGTWVRPADPEFLPTVYSDDVLVTKLDGKVPISSSSQPSLMAMMILALRVTPGLRILEIGAGTGYNAALLASLGATITSIDVQKDVAVKARSALARAGISSVRVEHGDGYTGEPGATFDRVIVTVGVGGVSPRWLAQLAPGGFVVAPVIHAGTHPILSVHGPADGPVTGVPVCASGFMLASGPLTAPHPGSFPAPVTADALGPLEPAAPARFDPPLDEPAYRDLWYAAGALTRRATHVVAPDHDHAHLGLVSSRTKGVVILPDGSVLAGPPDLVELATEVLDRWDAAGRPSMRSWQVRLALTGDRSAPIWAPSAWDLGAPE